jgi:hypothetical protein
MNKAKISNDQLQLLSDYRNAITKKDYVAYWTLLSERTKFYLLGIYHKRIDINFHLPTFESFYLEDTINQIIDGFIKLYGDDYIVNGGVSDHVRYPFDNCVTLAEIFVLKDIRTKIYFIAETEVLVWRIPICLEISDKGEPCWKIDLVRKMTEEI